MVLNRTPGLPPTVSSILEMYGPSVRQEFEPICRERDIEWPPRRLQLLAFKEEGLLEVWGANLEGPFHQLATFPVAGLSGKPGPKRRSGDLQVPEGFYRLTNLNPQSTFHLSVRVDYPNDEDIRNAEIPREQMGGDIYIHGGTASVGCLAMGDPAIEKIFCLVAQADPDNRQILISPADFRLHPSHEIAADAPWVAELYTGLKQALSAFPPDPALVQATR